MRRAAAVSRGSLRALVLVLEFAVGTRVEQGLVAVVEPHELGRAAVFAADLEDLAVAVGLADLLAVDDEASSDGCVHRVLLRVLPAYAGGRERR